MLAYSVEFVQIYFRKDDTIKYCRFRKIFWSDWNRASPKLEWANEDGTDRAIFLQGDYVKLPNSLSIDWSTDELCWADAGTFTISKYRF